MKKLILFFVLTTISFSQSADFLLLMNDGISYKNAETKVYLASLTTPISPTYAATLDSFITMVKDSLSITSLSQKIDAMWDLSGYNQEQSLRNMVKRSHDATAVNSPTWTQWQGFTGADTKYLNTNYNPTTSAVLVSRNNASYGVYTRLALASANEVEMGSITSTNFLTIYSRFTDNNAPFKAHSSSYSTYAVSNRQGFYIAVRADASTQIGYKNGSLGISGSVASVALVNENITILRGGGMYTTNQVAFAFIGAGLSAIEVSKFTNCVEWLMDRKGTGVIP